MISLVNKRQKLTTDLAVEPVTTAVQEATQMLEQVEEALQADDQEQASS